MSPELPGLSALPTWPVGVVGLGRLDDIGRRRLGRIRRIPGKRSHLFDKIGHLVVKCGVLLSQRGDLGGQFGNPLGQAGVLLAKRRVCGFEFRDPSQEGLFPGRFHRPLRVGLLIGLSDARGPPLEFSEKTSEKSA